MNSDKYIFPEEYHERMNKGEKLTLIDVRDPEEFEQGHLDGAICIPVHELSLDSLKEHGIDESRIHDELILYCLSGARSAMACELAQDLGFTNVRNIYGGIMNL